MIVGIHGGGVAAATCAHLLEIAGHAVSRDNRAGAVPLPSLMLSGASLALLRDVYGTPDLLARTRPVTRRLVAWGGRDPVVMPHDGIVVSQATLQDELEGARRHARRLEASEFRVITAGPLPESEQRIFGDRVAAVGRVTLRDADGSAECRVEALHAGWLFLMPGDQEGLGWLFGFGGSLQELLAESRFVAGVVDLDELCPVPFETAPRLSLPLAGADWLACGTAALRFDPICGDGTAQAVREAVLASAVIGAIAEGGDSRPLLAHYRAMLVAAMRRHLDLCARFYAAGGVGPWWQSQAAALIAGHRTCTRLLARIPEPQYVLRGFALEPKAAAA